MIGRVLAGFLNLDDLLRSGVYALTLRGEVIYVGQTKTLLERLWRHWHNRNKVFRREAGWSKVKGIPFDGLWVRPVPIADLDSVEREMIAKYRPRHNDRLVPKVEIPAAILAGLGIKREEFVRRV